MSIISILLSTALAHSWLDCVSKGDDVITNREQFYNKEDNEKCVGYGRNYVGRENKDINTIYTYSVIGRDKKKNICSDEQQKKVYDPNHPMASFKAGDKIKMWWEADNHYDAGKMVDLYWTQKPDKELQYYGDLTPDRKLATMPFANDKNCFNVKNTNSYCWGTFDLPKDLENGVYSFYWDFKLDKAPVGESYITCFDIKIV